jgi:hypothetical protein
MSRRMSVMRCKAAVVHCDGKSWSTPVLLFLVLVCLALLIPSTALAAPSISLAPSSGLWGTTTTVTGGGFSNNRSGYVWFDTDKDGVRDTGEPSRSVRTTNQGNIPSGVTLTVPTGLVADTYPIQADVPTWGSIEASAPFTVVKPSITASAGANGSISPSGSVEVDYTANQAFDITPNTGYHVADVLVDGASVGAVTSYEFANVTADHTIAASFAIDTFTISAMAGANGTIAPSGDVVVDYGGSQGFTIAPATGYHVADVVVDGVAVGQVISYEFANVTGNHSISATFAINVYTINASAGTNGTISPSGHVWLNHGSSQSFSIVPNTSCYIADVLVDGVSMGAVSSYEFTDVAADHTISAAFVQDTTPPAVPAFVSPASWGKIDGNGSLDWSDVSDPSGVTYQVRLYNSSWFVISEISGLTASEFPVASFGFLPDSTYYWKMRAVDGVGNGGAWPSSRAFRLAATVPSVPVQLSPASYSYVTGSSLLDWSDVTDPQGVTYEARLYSSSWTLLATVTGLTSSDCNVSSFGSLADGLYYWKVRAVDGGGVGSAWTGSRAIKLANTVPSTPVQLSPASYARVTGSGSLDWSDVTDPEGVTYEVRLYNSSWSLLATVGGLASSDCAVSSFGSLADGTYFWNVRAADGAGNRSAWTTSLAFRLAATIPSAPVHLSPASWVRVNSSGSLDWSDVTDPEGVTYDLQLYDNSWNLLTTKTGLSSSEYALSSFGSLADATYFWKVSAVDGVGNRSPWTTSWAFRVDNTLPSVPALVSPGDGATTSSNPTLDWSDVTDASGVKYQVQVDDNSGFSSPLLDASSLTASQYIFAAGENLPAGTYYWRVRAVDGAGNASAWSGVWSFVV